MERSIVCSIVGATCPDLSHFGVAPRLLTFRKNSADTWSDRTQPLWKSLTPRYVGDVHKLWGINFVNAFRPLNYFADTD